MTLADRRNVDSASVNRAERAATIRADNVTEAVDGMYRAVSVVSPGGVYTLASGQSPLLLVARKRTAHRHQRRPACGSPTRDADQ